MHIGTITAVIGFLISALGSLWYWQIMQVATAFAGTTITVNLDRTAYYAIGLVCFGLVVFLIGMAVSFLAKDEDAQ